MEPVYTTDFQEPVVQIINIKKNNKCMAFLNLRCGVKLMTAVFILYLIYCFRGFERILLNIKKSFFQWNYNIHETEGFRGCTLGTELCSSTKKKKKNHITS